MFNDLQLDLDCAKLEIEMLKEWIRNLQKTTQTLTCVYCGKAYPPGSPAHGAEVLTAHIKECPKHPMRKVEQKLKDLENMVLTLQHQASIAPIELDVLLKIIQE